MKKETQASKSEGVLDLRQHPIDPEHYGQVAHKTAEALATEIARRLAQRGGWQDLAVHQAAANTLYEWFTGKFTPGGPTDPPDGAPAREENKGGPSSPE